VLERPAKPVEPPNNENVSFANYLAQLIESASLPRFPACHFDDNLLAARLLQGIFLQSEVLILGRDAGISDFQVTCFLVS
jgi:hypothetical protein